MTRLLLVYSLHGILWSGYSIITFLSHQDRIEFKGILLGIFFYFAYLISRSILSYKKGAVLSTLLSICFFMLGKVLFQLVI